jgi:UDP-N-acetyl-D-mannosaminuronic acid dehydrogenase
MSLVISEFSEKIIEKKAIIGVLGLGQVGLPTALCVLNANYRVIGIDRDEKLIKSIASGKSPLPESGFEDLIRKFLSNNLLKVSSSVSLLTQADIIIVCVPTPLDGLTFSADLSYLKNALTEISVLLNKHQLIIIESTIPPNTIKNILIPHLEKKTGKKAGSDFLISYCPERISPGNSLIEFTNNARIIGAEDDDSLNLTHLFLKNITKGKILSSKSTTAELSKLAENSFRDLNIAFANELALICEQSGADVLEVIRLANSHPRVNIHLPGPGVGGPCLTKDPYMLIQGKIIDSSLIRLARNTNDSMPDHVVKTLLEVFEGDPNLKKPKILILGVAYKPGVNDTRKSPTIDIINKLKEYNIENLYVHDPYVVESFGATMVTEDLNTKLNNFDCIITVTAHPQYKELNKSLFKDSCIIVDAARIFENKQFVNTNITYLPLGSR